MLEKTFYHNTSRRYTVAFGTLFNGIRIERTNKAGDVIDIIPVPLIYSNKEKFIRRALQLSSISSDEPKVKETLPAMGFELLNISYSPNRKTNTMERFINDRDTKGKFMFNRVPYDFNFVLYIAARRTDDALRIVEQILPYFTPELNLRIREVEDFPDIITDVPVVLEDASYDSSVEGTFDDRRIITWQLTFTMKGYLYTNVRDVDLIKKTIVEMSNSDLNSFYEGYMSQIDPINSGSNDDHEVIEEVTNSEYSDHVLTAEIGASASIELDQ